MSLRLLALALTSVAISAGAARADLPAATYHASGGVSAPFGPYYGGNFKPLNQPGTLSMFSLSATMGPAPSPYIQLHMALAGDQYFAADSAKITYAFEVTGPEDILVPMSAFVVASALVDHTGNDAYGQYIVSVNAPQGAGFGISNGGGSYGGFDSFNGPIAFNVMANQVNIVTLTAEGYVQGTTTGHVDIYADPVFSFAGPTEGYSLSFSKGVGNSAESTTPAGVPEATSWALMLVGFGGIGATLRRRRAQRALVAS